MPIDYDQWMKSIYQHCDDPTQFNGKNPKCNIYECDKEIEIADEYCEDHQPCIICAERVECDCEDELSQRSNCCEARMDTDIKICYKCQDFCVSSWDEALEDLKRNGKS